MMILTKNRRQLAVAAAVIAAKDRKIIRLERELVNARLALAAVAREAEASRAQVAPEPVDAVFVEGIGNPLYDEARAATLGLQAVSA